MRPRRVGALLGPGLLAGCNAVLGLDASILEEGATTSTGTTGSVASGTTSSTASSTSSTTSGGGGAGGDGGEGGASTTTSSVGGGAGGDGGGGSDPCGTWGLIENGGFECGITPWVANGSAQLETFTPGYGDRGSAARHKVVGSSNPVYQPLGNIEIAPGTCFVASYAVRSSDGSGQVEATLGLIDVGRQARGALRNLGTSFAHHGPLSCHIAGESSGSVWFFFSFSGLTDEDVTVAIDAVEVTLAPCEGGEVDCSE